MSRHCAFLTLENRGEFFIYDHLLFAPLEERGWSVEEIPWNRPHVDWSQFEAVIIRSTWDYQADPARFLETLQGIAKVARLFNPVDICRWNLNKRYLLDLQQSGVSIVPTAWPDRLTPDAIELAFQQFETDRLVTKPLVGANADDTYVLRADDRASWQPALHTFGQCEAMVQPFLRSIVDQGEYSLFYFGGQLSHTIVKRPAEGDFRVQEEHGGVIQSTDAPHDMIDLGTEVMRALGNRLLYARVDLVRLESGTPALIELELIEPSLYFEQCDEAAERFADEFQRMMEDAAQARY
ncbi:MAG: hypothetical protein AAGF97_05660 [Planctomycetota bacterium]